MKMQTWRGEHSLLTENKIHKTKISKFKIHTLLWRKLCELILQQSEPKESRWMLWENGIKN